MCAAKTQQYSCQFIPKNYKENKQTRIFIKEANDFNAKILITCQLNFCNSQLLFKVLD